MWIAAVVVPLMLLAVPLCLAHLEERVISGGRPPGAPEAAGPSGLQAAAPAPLGVVPDVGPFARVARQEHRAA